MVLYRPHRGLLEDAMLEVVEVGTKEQLIGILIKSYEYISPEYVAEKIGSIDSETVTVEYYCEDERINWSTYIVCINGMAQGFTNGPL